MAFALVTLLVAFVAIINGKTIRYRDTLADDFIESIYLLNEEGDASNTQYKIDDPLSDDFIHSINKMNSTWKVS